MMVSCVIYKQMLLYEPVVLTYWHEWPADHAIWLWWLLSSLLFAI